MMPRKEYQRDPWEVLNPWHIHSTQGGQINTLLTWPWSSGPLLKAADSIFLLKVNLLAKYFSAFCDSSAFYGKLAILEDLIQYSHFDTTIGFQFQFHINLSAPKIEPPPPQN